ncbi:secretogranin-1 [Mantella aurantiaca]
MVPVLLLLSLLMGFVEVNAAPFDKGSRQEEMVTRCIIEVLSNALAKPNAPPIDPECKEILKKSSRHNQEEEGDEPKHYETRTIKDPGALDNHQHDSTEEAKQSPDLSKGEYEEKRHHAENENREEKEDEKVKEAEQVDEKEESTGHSKERAFAEGEDDDEEKGHQKDHYKKEEIEKTNRYHDDSQESTHDILDKRAHHATKHPEEFPGEDNEDDAKYLEEIIKRHPLSSRWKKQLMQPGRFNSINSSVVPEGGWTEWEEEMEKRSYKPNHEELRQRLFGYGEKPSHHEEPRNNPPDEKISYSKGQKPHFGEAYWENPLIKNDFDKRSHYDKESSEEVREKKHHHQDSEEEVEHQNSNEESNEKELNGHYYEDKSRHEERKRWPSQQNSRINYEESSEDSEESEEGIDKRHEHEQEKDNFYRKLKHHLQDSDEDEPFRQEKKPDEKRYYIGEEMVDGLKRYYPKVSQEKRQYGKSKNHHHYREDSEESNFPDNEMYKQNYAEEERRSLNKHRLSNDPLTWQSRYSENADNKEEDRKRSLQVKNIFPDYGDYDLWGKRQFAEDLNHQYGENRSPVKTHKFEDKREYDRMDELAQLLNYKKKSVEFPDFYDSEEIKKRHYDERGRFRERPLSEDEEKELENLAIMDLELQKIAEKLSNNRQG